MRRAMLVSFLSILSLLFAVAIVSAQTNDVVVLCVYSGPYTNNVNSHYLHPINVSTSYPSPSTQNVTFDTSRGSELIFTTDLHGWTAWPLSSSVPTAPLLLWQTGNELLYFSLNLANSVPQFHWSYPEDDRSGARVTWLSSTQSYWGATAVNDIGGGPCIFVLSVYKDIGKAINGGSADSPLFQSKTSIGQDTAGITGVVADQANNLIFIAIDTSTFSGEVGSLITYSPENNTVINQVDYTGAGTFGLVHSASRAQLFTYRINQENDGIIGIDTLDWKTGNSTVLIPASALPKLEFWDDSLNQFFVDDTGEWYFTVGLQNQTSYEWTSWVFSVNVDTRKVSNLVTLQYPSPEIEVLAIYARATRTQSPPMENEKVLRRQPARRRGGIRRG